MDFRSLFTLARSLETRSATASWDQVDEWSTLFESGRRKAGETITTDSALTILAVYAAVRMIAEGMGSLPVKAYRKDASGVATPMKSAPDWLDRPNPGLNLSRQDVISQALVSLLLRGNAYIFILREGFRIVGLEVLNPDAVTVRRSPLRASLIYTVDGMDYSGDDILHIRGLTLPGEILGLDPITYAAHTLGTGIAAQEYGANYMENAALPSGLITVPGTLSETGLTLMRSMVKRLFSGKDNAGKVAILTDGAEFKPLSLTPEQTQFLEVRRFTVQDVARLFGIPPHLLADSSNSTSWGSGLAEQNTAMSKLTLTPWAERIQTALTLLLRSDGSPRANMNAYVRVHLEGFERGSYKDRFETYAIGIAAGVYDPDEVRAWEDLPPMTDEQRERAKPAPPPAPPASPAAEPEGGSDDSSQETDE